MLRAGRVRYHLISMKKILIAVLLLGGCGKVPLPPGIAPYKIDIQQGNYVTQEMLAKLKPGMTRSQVRFALGTPLLVDPFRTDRWDYVYTLQKSGELTEQRVVTVIFRGDALERIEGDVVAGNSGSEKDSGSPRPAAAPPTTGSNVAKPAAKPAAEPPVEERGFFGRMLEKMGF